MENQQMKWKLEEESNSGCILLPIPLNIYSEKMMQNALADRYEGVTVNDGFFKKI